jgi:hypothetical protein
MLKKLTTLVTPILDSFHIAICILFGLHAIITYTENKYNPSPLGLIILIIILILCVTFHIKSIKLFYNSKKQVELIMPNNNFNSKRAQILLLYSIIFLLVGVMQQFNGQLFSEKTISEINLYVTLYVLSFIELILSLFFFLYYLQIKKENVK